MKQLINTTPQQETAVLVALITPEQSTAQVREHLDELAFLALTLGIRTLHTFVQSLKTPCTKTLVGKGKLEDIAHFVKENKVKLVIFDDELSPSQVRNLEHVLPCKVVDRTLLILNIFAMRAQTAQAKTQVALAQYQYLLPRLTRMWTHLSKQKGGSTGMRGPGEKELETDRRLVQKKIAQLRKKLKIINQQNITQRKTRTQLVRVALVGYTNVGKSTLMRVLSKENVYTEDRLFATVSATIRKVVIHDIPFLLTDTVGFIRKLPHTLIECFQATLDEVREADILLHVIDVANPAHEAHMQVVNETLQTLGASDIPTLLVFNKIDQYKKAEEAEINITSMHLQQVALPDKPAIYISAKKQENIGALKELLYRQVYRQHMAIYPHYLKGAGY
ncbi:MAG: GTPase HflX [Bacteroidota bacterium]